MNRKDINKGKVTLVFFGILFFIAIIIAPKSTEVNDPRAAFYYSIKENPIMFILLASVVVVPIMIIEHIKRK